MASIAAIVDRFKADPQSFLTDAQSGVPDPILFGTTPNNSTSSKSMTHSHIQFAYHGGLAQAVPSCSSSTGSRSMKLT